METISVFPLSSCMDKKDLWNFVVLLSACQCPILTLKVNAKSLFGKDVLSILDVCSGIQSRFELNTRAHIKNTLNPSRP
jgi:hypothetical protein